MGYDEKDRAKIAWEVFEELATGVLEKALKDPKKGDQVRKSELTQKPKSDPTSLFINPHDYVSQTGLWRERRAALDWSHLRAVATRNPIISAIINTRVNQVGTFSAPHKMAEVVGNAGLGYKIVHKDSGRKLTKAEEKYVDDLEQYIWACGTPGRLSIYGRDNFDIWLRKMVQDTLTFDAAATELVPTRRGGVAEFWAVDASTIRVAMIENGIKGVDGEKAYVQVMNGQIVAEYLADEMMYGIRNPSSSIYSYGYGTSEIEQLVHIVTNIFNALTHNAMFFKNGAAAKGIINIKPTGGESGQDGGNIQQGAIEAFKRAWRAMITGSANAWATPILQSNGVEFVNLGSSNREMEFMKYLDFLIKITCAVYAIDPAEINFYMQSGTNSGGSMFEANQEAKLKMSKDKGLRPLLSAFSRWVNQFIMPRIAPDFYFSFVGIDSKDEKEVIELRTKEVGSYKTVNEVRAEAGLDPLPDEKGGNLILNPQYTAYLGQQMMAAQMGGGGEEGPGGQGEGEEGQGEESAEPGGGEEGGEEIAKSLISEARPTKYIKIVLP